MKDRALVSLRVLAAWTGARCYNEALMQSENSNRASGHAIADIAFKNVFLSLWQGVLHWIRNDKQRGVV
jgi:hypothetical protein